MKILVIQTAFPGDAILTLPLIQKLKEKYSSSQIDVLCIPNTEIIFKNSSYVNSVISYDKRESQKSISSFLRLLRKIKSQNYWKVYSPHRSARSAVITFFSKAKKRIGFDNAALSFLYTDKVCYETKSHEVQRNLSLIGELDWKILPELSIPSQYKEVVEENLDGNGKFVAIAPGSIWATKRYPTKYYVELAESIVSKGYKVIIIGGENDSELGDEINRIENENMINLCGKLNFIESLYLLKKARLLISNDSAPTHLGVTADIPVLTIYCSTIPDFGFYPYNNSSKIISKDDLYCKPCGIHGHMKCPEGHFRCGLDLMPNEILKVAVEMLDNRLSIEN